jgi:type I restriction-modification system DNA methylase subunit
LHGVTTGDSTPRIRAPSLFSSEKLSGIFRAFMPRSRPATETNSSANIGFEQKLWLAADKLRSNMDAAEHKHVVLGLIFLKYISDSFEEHHAKLVAGTGDYAGANPEDHHDDDARWQFGLPPRGNANFAWVQHFIYHLAPTGMAGFVLFRFCF